MKKRIKLAAYLLLFLISCAPLKTELPLIEYELPGVVALIDMKPDGSIVSKCTGVLVRPSAVITAAHCIDGKSDNISTVYGCSDIGHNECQKANAVKRKLADVYDVGLVILDKDISHNVGMAEIADDLPRLTQHVTVAGFGHNGRLRHGVVPIWTLNKHSYVTNCTNKDGFRPEPGDSGGPSYILDQKKLLLSAIVTTVTIVFYKDDILFVGAIYEDVSMHKKWIDEVCSDLNCGD